MAMAEKTVPPMGKRRRYLSHYTRKNYVLLGFGLLFLLGVSVGTSLYSAAETNTLANLSRLMHGFVENRSHRGFSQNFASAAASSLFLVGVLFFCGFSAVAQPVELLVPFFRGLGFGFSIASLYHSYGAGAAGYVALFVLPGMVLSSLAILFCCRESLRFSRSFFRLMSGGEGRYSVRLYLARYCAAVLVCVTAAFLEACVCVMLAQTIVLG